MSKSDNYGLPESVGKSFPLEDDVPRFDYGNGNQASLPPPPPIILLDPHVRRLENFKVTQALLTKRHKDGKSVCAHVLDMKLHIDRLGMLGVDVSEKLAVDLVLQRLPDSYAMIWRTGQANSSGESMSHPSMGIGNIGSPEKISARKRKDEAEIVPCTIPEDSLCFYCQKKGNWLRSTPKAPISPRHPKQVLKPRRSREE
ncbi:hypothetical protein Lser_V15G00327 [Lactuca serriola]